MEAGKINQDDIQTHIIAEDTEDLVKSRKNYVWDKSKKRFVIGKLNEKGDLQKDKPSKSKDASYGKKVFEKWTKNNQIKRQKEGEQEDENMVSRAKQLFSGKGKFGNRNAATGGAKVRSELKNSNQIMKVRLTL